MTWIFLNPLAEVNFKDLKITKIKIGYVKKLKALMTITVLITVSACQTVPKRSQPSEPGSIAWLTAESFAEKPIREIPDDWRYSGKMGIKTSDVKESANIIWNYSDQNNQVRLFGPLGAGALRLDFDAYGVVLTDNKGIKHFGDNAQVLLEKLTGWPLPVSSLSSWLFAKPDQNSAFEFHLDADGNLLGLRQNGWEIAYSGYRLFDDVWMPRKILAKKSSSTGNHRSIKVTLVTKSWSIGAHD